mmetsp:Transcript_95757/g.275945  ORF Transcript_95757/g.275945 Transcript_95757/m.275945 type:complete len:215 (+) Transcript_95757:968-1612(+)
MVLRLGKNSPPSPSPSRSSTGPEKLTDFERVPVLSVKLALTLAAARPVSTAPSSAPRPRSATSDSSAIMPASVSDLVDCGDLSVADLVECGDFPRLDGVPASFTRRLNGVDIPDGRRLLTNSEATWASPTNCTTDSLDARSGVVCCGSGRGGAAGRPPAGTSTFTPSMAGSGEPVSVSSNSVLRRPPSLHSRSRSAFNTARPSSSSRSPPGSRS